MSGFALSISVADATAGEQTFQHIGESGMVIMPFASTF
jgi:hypothetical protein